MNLKFFTAENYNKNNILKFWENNDITLSESDYNDIFREDYYNTDLFIIIEDKNGIASTCWGTYDGRRGYIIHLAVRKNLRGKGIGKLTLKHVEKKLKEVKCSKIHLFIEKSNSQVVNFYEKLGYEKRNDIILMSKNII
ncbi:MAG TPA: GNAT family N-acetyltransferase [Candidatus Mcinerneyibacterium sp.]|nr:GNAT family N-acetyltransferase [Candidatus Mcinerneyibacterium sp.]